MAGDYEFTYLIVNTVLVGIFIKPLFILWCISLCLARRRNDPARTAFTWLKVVYPLMVLSLTLFVVSDCMTLVEITLQDEGYAYLNEDTIRILDQVSERTGNVGNLIELFGDVCLLVTFVELGNGFLYCLTLVRSQGQQMRRYGILALGLVLTALNIAEFAVDAQIFTTYYGYDDEVPDSFVYGAFDTAIRTERSLSGAFAIVYFVIMLGVLGYVCYVMNKCSSHPTLHNSAVLFVVAAVLNVIRYAWAVAFYATWYLGKPVTEGAPRYASIMGPIFDAWALFVLLVLLYTIGVRKQQGLWTTPQPWTGGATQAYVQGYVGAYGQPQSYQQGVWGQQPVMLQQGPGQGYYYQQPAVVSAPPPAQVPSPSEMDQPNGYQYPHELK